MPTLLKRIQTLWDNVRAGETKTRAHFKVDPANIHNPEPLGSSFEAGQHYFQVMVNEMFLANSRKWFVEYDPMVFAAASYLYDKETSTFPKVVGPALLTQYQPEQVPQGTIFENTPVSALRPYQGGELTFTIILNALQRQNNADRLLQLVESISSAVPPAAPVAMYLPIARSVVDGIESLLGLNETEPMVGYRLTINPDLGGNELEPSYFALINEDENVLDSAGFQVRNDRLYYGEKRYCEKDFVLFSVTQGVRRTDERTLPFYPLWQTAQDLAAQAAPHYWEEAKANFNALKRALLASPDLTEPDSERLIDQYLERLKELRREAIEESELGPEDLSGMEAKYYRIADELSDLD